MSKKIKYYIKKHHTKVIGLIPDPCVLHVQVFMSKMPKTIKMRLSFWRMLEVLDITTDQILGAKSTKFPVNQSLGKCIYSLQNFN